MALDRWTYYATDAQASAGLFAPGALTVYAHELRTFARLWVRQYLAAKRAGARVAPLRRMALLAMHRARVARQRGLTRHPPARLWEVLDWQPGATYNTLTAPRDYYRPCQITRA